MANLRRFLVPTAALAVALLFLAVPSSAYEIDYATWDVRLTDTQGIVTEAEDFGFWAGPNVLSARRGEGVLEIPFRKMRSLELGAYLPEKGLYPCTVVAKNGKLIACHIERIEGQRLMGGESDIGAYRIRLGQIRRLELLALTGTQE